MEYTCLVFVCVIVFVSGCTDFPPWVRNGNDEDADMKYVHYAQRVIFATVKKLMDDPKYARPGVQAAKLDIVCIYKGGQLMRDITVVGTGNLGGEIFGCPASNLTVGESYIFFLYDNDNRQLEIEFPPVGGESYIILDDISINCGLTREFPPGLSREELNALEEECYEPLKIDEGCYQYVPPTTTTTTTAAKTTKAPEVTTKKVVVNPGNGGSYETKGGDNTSKGGKASGSTHDDNGNSASGMVVSWTLLTLLLIFAFL